MKLRTRFAPTPSGYLHAGNAFSFVLTWLCARSKNGSILLRIDDLDSTRKRPEYVSDIFASIEWLGLDYDEGPSGPGDFEQQFSQLRRLDLYVAALEYLRAEDKLFPCVCSRSSISAAGGEHPTQCQSSEATLEQDNVAWRIRTDNQPITWRDSSVFRDMQQPQQSVTLNGSMKDFVVRRKDRVPAYQLASLVDDRHFDINFLVRGEDLLESTAAQRFLAQHLGYVEFLNASLVHHPLIRNPDGTKLSKSAGSTSLRAMRELDPSASEFYRQASVRLGLPEIATDARTALAMWNEATRNG